MWKGYVFFCHYFRSFMKAKRYAGLRSKWLSGSMNSSLVWDYNQTQWVLPLVSAKPEPAQPSKSGERLLPATGKEGTVVTFKAVPSPNKASVGFYLGNLHIYRKALWGVVTVLNILSLRS
jgi:hypothetical protein